jgi:hypothetical protein
MDSNPCNTRLVNHIGNTMIADNIFYGEKKWFRKFCLLLTIPCAIAPMLVATFGWLQPAGNPLLFMGEKIIFGLIYVLYMTGLVYSFIAHKHLFPLFIFLLHVAALITFWNMEGNDWISYPVILSLVAASIINQYFRVGAIDCTSDTCTPDSL